MSHILIHNVETGEVIERDMTAEELSQLEADKIAVEAKLQAQAEVLAKKAEAEAKLAALGLTAEDLKALGLS